LTIPCAVGVAGSVSLLKLAGKDVCLLALLSNCIVRPLRTMGSMSPSRGLASNRLATRIRPLGCFVIVS
jgi:hypothetical protein